VESQVSKSEAVTKLGEIGVQGKKDERVDVGVFDCRTSGSVHGA
jgi:hypothetical protein